MSALWVGVREDGETLESDNKLIHLEAKGSYLGRNMACSLSICSGRSNR
jgi:phage gp36-like protein